MSRIPDTGVFAIYFSLFAIYGSFSLWLLNKWRKTISNKTRTLLFALMFLSMTIMFDNGLWLFGTMAYKVPPSLIINQFIKTYNIWAFEKILWGIAGLYIFYLLACKKLMEE